MHPDNVEYDSEEDSDEPIPILEDAAEDRKSQPEEVELPADIPQPHYEYQDLRSNYTKNSISQELVQLGSQDSVDVVPEFEPADDHLIL